MTIKSPSIRPSFLTYNDETKSAGFFRSYYMPKQYLGDGRNSLKWKRAKVVHLTSVHPPFDIRIFHKECKTLAEDGYEVIIVAPSEQDGVFDRIRIRAVPKAQKRWQRMTRTVWQVYQVALAEDAQIYHFHDPELIPVGILLKLHGKLAVYDVHEDLPRQILSKDWIPRGLRSLVAKIAEIVETISAWIFDGIIAATPSIAERFPAQKTLAVHNFPIFGELEAQEPILYDKRPPLVVYIGGIEAIRGIKETIQSITMIPKSLETRLVLAGALYPAELINELKQLSGWKFVDFVGWLSRQEIARLLSQARIGVVLLHPRPNFLESYPIKLFEYMSASIPVVASDFPLWRKIIEGAGCGLLVNPLDPKAIANAIQWLLEHPQEAEIMGRRGLEAIRMKYNWTPEAQNLKIFYQKLCPAVA
jgi:glycosyltransferase involved in cell wall biosynthesis